MSKETLNTVDEAGNIIGEASRDKVHRVGLLHREVNILLFTPDGDLIFQRRGKHKDTLPGKLDVTVGGHVGLNLSFDESAVQEMQEETGLVIPISDLINIGQWHTTFSDPTTGAINNVIRRVYAYRYLGSTRDLQVEVGESDGFEEWPIAELFKITKDKAEEFNPLLLKEPFLSIYRQLLAK